jgi:hypothetical protein
MNEIEEMIAELTGLQNAAASHAGEIAVSTRLFHLFREGLMNGVVLPEVQTESEQAAHQLLGCDRYSALLAVYGTALDLRDDPELGPGVAELVEEMANHRLILFAQEIVRNRAPLGPHTCVETS